MLGTARPLLLTLLLAANLVFGRAPATDDLLTTRSTTDRADDVTGPQIHVVYALPADGIDRQLDINGTIDQSIAIAQGWLRNQNGGRGFRLDTSGGSLDVTFFRSSRTDADLKSTGAFVRDALETEMRSSGAIAADKIYIVYYDGGSSFACGGGAWPLDLPGYVGALYLQGTPPGAFPCGGNPIGAGSAAAPGYWEFSALHETMHTLGFVQRCAPNHVLSGHVGDDPRDLMYAGSQPWQPSILDVNGDDYLTPAAPGCLATSQSPFFEGSAPAGGAPFGSFDTPAELTSNLAGSIAITGWALDDKEVAEVQIWRDPVSSDPSSAIFGGGAPRGGKVFVGYAALVSGARPDVEAAFPGHPFKSRAGWGYLMLTRGFPWDTKGWFRLYAIATDRDGNVVEIGRRFLSVSNAGATKPFGAIDTPGQGATASGTYPNTGWVLTPNAGATIPATGVRVAIDGVFLTGTPSTSDRADISAGFPQFNTSGAGRGLFIDTTKYSDGAHTIGWLVTDSSGRADGVGSRYFTVANGTSAMRIAGREPAAAEIDALPLDARALRVRTGWDLDADLTWREVDRDGRIAIDGKELDRFEVRLDEAAPARWRGYLRVAGSLRPLPVGSHLAEGGTFTWQPATGFVGAYDLVFVREGRSRREVTLILKPGA